MKEAPDDIVSLMADFESVKNDVAFVRALRNLKIVTAASSDIALQYAEGSANALIDLRSLTPSGAPASTGLPDQGGNAGKVLTTDGATASWI